jgi:hypothetical protein
VNFDCSKRSAVPQEQPWPVSMPVVPACDRHGLANGQYHCQDKRPLRHPKQRWLIGPGLVPYSHLPPRLSRHRQGF